MFCDDPDRVAARIYATIRHLVDDPSSRGEWLLPDCPCCAFWRGVASALIVVGLLAGGAFLLIQ